MLPLLREAMNQPVERKLAAIHPMSVDGARG
jgi:hypothetical protein